MIGAMCSMEKCRTLINYLPSDHRQITFYNLTDEVSNLKDFYIYDFHRMKLFKTSQEYFRKKVLSLEKSHALKFLSDRHNKFVIYKHREYNGEFLLFDVIGGSINLGSAVASKFSSLLNLIKGISGTMHNMAEGIRDPSFTPWLIDMLKFLTDVLDPYWSFKKLFLNLVSLYTLGVRLLNWKADHFQESLFDSFSFLDLAAAFSLVGIPSRVVEILRSFSLLTGKRMLETSTVLELATNFIDIVVSILNFFFVKTHFQFFRKASDLLNTAFSFINNYRLVKELDEIFSTFNKDPQIVFDLNYRTRVLDFEERTKGCISFMDYVSNDQNRRTKIVYDSFCLNILKYVKTFTISSRQEPLCFVIEGKAGKGKSLLMNRLVDVLKHQNRSVYVHSTPPVGVGKDFYDDYQNQEIFIMDDVGQQGKSQWRTLINFISPVKYPLECAKAELKNTKFLNSKIVIMTTNNFRNLHSFTDKDGIGDTSALFRRAHVLHMPERSKASYWKYDYTLENPAWKNEFLLPHKLGQEMVCTLESRDNESVLKWAYKIIKVTEMEQERHLEELLLTPDQIQEVVDDVDNDLKNFDLKRIMLECGHSRFKPESGNPGMMNLEPTNRYMTPATLGNAIRNSDPVIKRFFIRNLVEDGTWMVLDELVRYAIRELKDLFDFVIDEAKAILTMWAGGVNSLVRSSKLIMSVCVGVMTLVSFNMVYKMLIGKRKELGVKEAVKEWSEIKFSSESFTETRNKYDDDYLKKARSNFRFFGIEGKFENSVIKTTYVQGVVSGKRCLLPYHALGFDNVVTVYKSYIHYEDDTRELDRTRVKILKVFSDLDLAVVEFENMNVPLYPKANGLFKEEFVKSSNCVNGLAQNLYFVNSVNIVEFVLGGNINFNSSTIQYRTVHREYEHKVRDGLVYPISSQGLCGSLILSTYSGWHGVHIAGNGNDGFAIMPKKEVRREISDLMLEGRESAILINQDKDLEGMSGARLKYETGKIELSYPIKKTNLVPTALHRDYCESMRKIMEEENVGSKVPPNFSSFGDPRKTLEKLSLKSFKNQGNVDREELDFARDVVETLFTEFDDLSHEETVFGSKDMSPLDKHTANGYGWMNNKENYFDYKEKTTTDEFMERIRVFEEKCNDDNVDIEDLLAKESFKDELRAEEKADSPRTFRVLPLHHTYFLKKCTGNLAKHFKKNMWKNGMAIGLNPYKDWDRLARLLLTYALLFDIDFSKWDGSMPALLQLVINDLILKYYKGKHRKVLEVILNSIVKGYVLVGDALWSTTHGMPSGTWLTLIINSLVNKMISAMALYRSMKKVGRKATIKDFSRLLDWTCGDDKLCGAPQGYEQYFNAFTVQEIAMDLGMTCTDGQKNEIKEPGVPFEKIVFLKRNFRNRNGKYVGTLDKTTILNTLQYFDRTKDYDVVMLGKSVAMQIEAELHGTPFRIRLLNLINSVIPTNVEFSLSRIEDILESDEGYHYVLGLLGKNYKLTL